MYYSPSLERLCAPYVAGWWLGMVVYLHWWASLGGGTEPQPRQHLRLVTDNGRPV
jgi:hypothetical protein